MLLIEIQCLILLFEFIEILGPSPLSLDYFKILKILTIFC